VATVVWTGNALRDVSRLHDFLAGKDRSVAVRAVRAIRAGARLLRRYPELGRVIENTLPEMRELITPFSGGADVMSDRYDPERIVILAVRHGREAGL
jgi:plasmid stabilization system protein ParE